MKEKNEGKGFKGLSSLGSNLDSDKSTSPKSRGGSASRSESISQDASTYPSTKHSSGLSAPSSAQSTPKKEKSPATNSQKPSSSKSHDNKPSRERSNSKSQKINKSQTEVFPPKKDFTGKYWFFGIIGFFIFIIFIGQGADNTSSPSAQSTSQPSTVSTTPPHQTPSASSPALNFSVPPVGSSQLLNIAQIRWCLRESISIDTRRSLTSTNVLTNRFNQQVDFYNIRCANFRYHVVDMNRARREVESMRPQIVAEARRTFTTSSTATAARASSSEFSSMGLTFRRPSTSSPSNPIFSIEEIRWCLREHILLDVYRRNVQSDADLNQYNTRTDNFRNLCLQPWRQSGNDYETAQKEIERVRIRIINSVGGFLDRQVQLIYEIQWLLNQLDYESGQIDGLYGPITRRAIESFERDTGQPITGRVTIELRNSLRAAANE